MEYTTRIKTNGCARITFEGSVSDRGGGSISTGRPRVNCCCYIYIYGVCSWPYSKCRETAAGRSRPRAGPQGR